MSNGVCIKAVPLPNVRSWAKLLNESELQALICKMRVTVLSLQKCERRVVRDLMDVGGLTLLNGGRVVEARRQGVDWKRKRAGSEH